MLRPLENAPPATPEAPPPLDPRQVLDAWDINRKESEKAPPAAKSKGARRWLKTIEDDEKWLEKNLTANATQAGPAGFMDFKKELIIAQRDAAGLRWGGADPGGDNGDLMHFDGGTMSTAQKLRKAGAGHVLRSSPPTSCSVTNCDCTARSKSDS